jgi:Ca-activated chloride channel homolog
VDAEHPSYCQEQSHYLHTEMLRIALSVGIAATLASGLFAYSALEVQDAPPKFKAGVALVPISAVVRDARGRLISDLTRDDFEVLENKQRRPIVEFRSTDNAPVSLALLFDTSSSMSEANHVQGKSVINALLTAMDPKIDEAALFTFDQRLRQDTPFTNDPEVIRAATAKTLAWGQTSLYDAVGEAAKRLAERPSARQAVLVITDGVDTSSSGTASDVSKVASSVDVPVYVVSVAGRRRRFGGGDSSLSNLARATGGEQLQAVTPEQAATAVAALMSELRQQYFLAIESAVAPGWYGIEVRTRQNNLRVRARSGYQAVSH